MKTYEAMRLIVSNTILRNLILLVALSSLLFTFPFRGVWAIDDPKVIVATYCERNPATNAATAYCASDAVCGFLAETYDISLWIQMTGFCSTSPVRNSARTGAIPGAEGLDGYAESLVLATGVP